VFVSPDVTVTYAAVLPPPPLPQDCSKHALPPPLTMLDTTTQIVAQIDQNKDRLDVPPDSGSGGVGEGGRRGIRVPCENGPFPTRLWPSDHLMIDVTVNLKYTG
jgi:hypothetical protein